MMMRYLGGGVSDYHLSFDGDEITGLPFEYGSWPALGNADFFSKIRKEFADKKIDFIEADLSAMKLKVYNAGVIVKEFPILTKGKEGSWWETPAGIYRVQSKEKDHFSSFGQVYQPWSMAFQGNFFIHGWPYYPNGTPVKSTYSGGCIRLSTEDAKAVFDLVKVGTPVLVFEKDFTADDFKYTAKLPEISASSYLAADLKNNFVFLGKKSQEVMPIASITKLITAVVATEYIDIEKEVTVLNSAIVLTSKPRLWAGQRISVFNLLFPLLEESSNEAAVTLANNLGSIRFVDLMNNKAKALGMSETKFTDPAGSEEGNVSTAEDLFNMAKYFYNNRSFILKISAGKLSDSAYGEPLYGDIENFNVFKDDPDFVGGKVGKTNPAKETIVSIFDLMINGTRRPIVIIALGSEDSAKDATNILNYIRTNY